MWRLLVPSQPRTLPLRRPLKVALRTLHTVAAAILTGGIVFSQPREALHLWIVATIASGALLLALDLYASFAVLLEVRGMVVLVKIALIASLPAFWEQRIAIVIGALMLGAVSSHSAGAIRHHVLVLRDRVVPDRRKG